MNDGYTKKRSETRLERNITNENCKMIKTVRRNQPRRQYNFRSLRRQLARYIQPALRLHCASDDCVSQFRIYRIRGKNAQKKRNADLKIFEMQPKLCHF